jgi:hypothetical protein
MTSDDPANACIPEDAFILDVEPDVEPDVELTGEYVAWSNANIACVLTDFPPLSDGQYEQILAAWREAGRTLEQEEVEALLISGTPHLPSAS